MEFRFGFLLPCIFYPSSSGDVFCRPCRSTALGELLLFLFSKRTMIVAVDCVADSGLWKEETATGSEDA